MRNSFMTAVHRGRPVIDRRGFLCRVALSAAGAGVILDLSLADVHSLG